MHFYTKYNKYDNKGNTLESEYCEELASALNYIRYVNTFTSIDNRTAKRLVENSWFEVYLDDKKSIAHFVPINYIRNQAIATGYLEFAEYNMGIYYINIFVPYTRKSFSYMIGAHPINNFYGF